MADCVMSLCKVIHGMCVSTGCRDPKLYITFVMQHNLLGDFWFEFRQETPCSQINKFTFLLVSIFVLHLICLKSI